VPLDPAIKDGAYGALAGQRGIPMFEQEKQLRWSKIKVGLVISLAILILFLAVFFAGKIEILFSPKMLLKAQFRDVKGLRKGAPVWIFGTEVGSVQAIDLDPIYRTIVTVSINKSVRDLIKKDSTASIMAMGLLGDKYMELTTGSPAAEPVESGEMIQGMAQVELTEIAATGAMTIEKTADLVKRIDMLVQKIEKGEGTMAKFIMNPSVYDNLDKSIRTLSILLEDIKTSRGTLKRMIEDPALYDRMLSAASSVEEFAKKLNESPGTLRKLLEDPQLYDKLVAAISSIETFSRKLNEESGTLKKLVEDPELYDKLLAASSSIETFSRKLNEESGTLKKLVEDPELYDNLNQVSRNLASILTRLDRGDGVAGTLIRDNEMALDLKETLAKFKELTAEMGRLAEELKLLTKDIKENPKKYFKFSIF
jgi:phospholipid/cholesterol/gamma-HCH transport system substrate-binding protein